MSAYAKNFCTLFLLLTRLSVPVGYSAEAKPHKKLFYGIGAGGEPKGPSTQFDSTLSVLGNFSGNPGWDMTVSFDGGHPKTEELIATKFKKAKNVGSFTETNYNKIIDEMIAKIENKEVIEKDQMMLVIDTHGAQKSKDEKTHSIALAHSEAVDLRSLAGAKTVDLDKLEKLVAVAAKNKVKLAIVDLSCFSGNLLNIKHQDVCMISGSGTDHYGYSGAYGFGARFFEQLRPGKNLEQAFLQARFMGANPDFPMISTDEGQAVDAILYKALSPYLIYNDPTTTDFIAQYTVNDVDKFQEQACVLSSNHEQFAALLTQIKDVYKITGQVAESKLASLRKALKDYRDYQIKYEDSLRGKFEVEAEITAILERDFSDKESYWRNYTKLDLLTTDFKKQARDVEEIMKSSDDSNKVFQRELILKSNQQDQIAQQLKSKLSTSSKAKLKTYADVMSKANTTWKLAQAVGFEARNLYHHLYMQMRSEASNPCRDFVL